MQFALESNVPGPEPAAPPRSKWFWAGWGVVAASQLVAFWLLCSHQVRVADERRGQIQVQRLALADCLQSVPRSTVASCTARLTAMVPETVIAGEQPAAMPVSFNFR